MTRKKDGITIAVDFDGTIVKHEYPEVGEPNPGAIEWIKKFQEHGASIILFTMRSDNAFNQSLTEAVNYVEENGIELDGVNTNPGQEDWTSSPKAYAQIYIDDAAFGCPLIDSEEGRPYVDWDVVGPEVLKMIISGTQ